MKIYLMPAKFQGFVQMESHEAAALVVGRYGDAGVMLRGKSVHLQYSQRDEISVSESKTQGGVLGGSGDGQSQATANSILITTVLNTRIPVTIENLQQVFKPFGDVLKIVTFSRNNIFKALVQMAHVENALAAKSYLDGKDLFQGCCHLRVDFSNLTELKVTTNDAKSRDFTVHGGQMLDPHGMAHPLFNKSGGAPYGGLVGGAAGGMGALAAGFPGSAQGYGDVREAGSVVLVNNIDAQLSVNDLFMLFGVYGDVVRVKILFNKRETAMVQFANAQGAATAQSKLNRLNIFGKELVVSISKHTEVGMPRADADPESQNLTKDFANSPVHRFRGRTLRVAKNIHAPSAVLHVANLHDKAAEEEVQKIFGQFSSFTAVRFFKNSRKMAYVRMASVQDAVVALMRLHNTKVEGQYLRVSFSGQDPLTFATDAAPSVGGDAEL